MISLEPLFAERPPILACIGCIRGFGARAAQFALPKGTPRHRAVGFAWAGLMLFIAASGFWIYEIRLLGPWSPIHLLSGLVLITVPLAVWHAHRHHVARHRSAMISLYLFALIGAGLFTLLPGRVMHTVIFGG